MKKSKLIVAYIKVIRQVLSSCEWFCYEDFSSSLTDGEVREKIFLSLGSGAKSVEDLSTGTVHWVIILSVYWCVDTIPAGLQA